MEHATDIELIELVGKRLDAAREKAILVHLEGCARCCAKLVDIRNTWDILGAWDVRPEHHLDVERLRVLAEQAGAPATGSRTIRLHAASTLLRVAASIVVATLIGYLGGRWSFAWTRMPLSSESPPYLSALGLEVGQSLSSLVLDDDVAAGEGG